MESVAYTQQKTSLDSRLSFSAGIMDAVLLTDLNHFSWLELSTFYINIISTWLCKVVLFPNDKLGTGQIKFLGHPSAWKFPCLTMFLVLLSW